MSKGSRFWHSVWVLGLANPLATPYSLFTQIVRKFFYSGNTIIIFYVQD